MVQVLYLNNLPVPPLSDDDVSSHESLNVLYNCVYSWFKMRPQLFDLPTVTNSILTKLKRRCVKCLRHEMDKLRPALQSNIVSIDLSEISTQPDPVAKQSDLVARQPVLCVTKPVPFARQLSPVKPDRASNVTPPSRDVITVPSSPEFPNRVSFCFNFKRDKGNYRLRIQSLGPPSSMIKDVLKWLFIFDPGHSLRPHILAF